MDDDDAERRPTVVDMDPAGAEDFTDEVTVIEGAVPEAEVTPSRAITKRTPISQQELDHDNAKAREGGVIVLEALQAWFVHRAGLDPALAARYVQEVARESGILLL